MSDQEALAIAFECAGHWGADWGPKPVASDIVLTEKRGAGSLVLVAKGEDVVDCITVEPKDGVAGADLFSPSPPPPTSPERTRPTC